MTTAVRKWGNNPALRIPRTYAAETNLAEGSEVEFRSGVLQPVARKRHKLKTLLRGVSARNRHAAIDAGPAIGRER